MGRVMSTDEVQRVLYKKLKNYNNRYKIRHPPCKKKSVLCGAACACKGGEPKGYSYLKNFIIFVKRTVMKHFGIPPSMMGYEIAKGRLINNAPSPEMGIQKLAQLKKAKDRFEKVQIVAEGNELAKANIDLFKKDI
jgi:hypothetical protein